MERRGFLKLFGLPLIPPSAVAAIIKYVPEPIIRGATGLTIDQITNEVLRLAHAKMQFIGTINRQFDENFGLSTGRTLTIRMPKPYKRKRTYVRRTRLSKKV